MMLGSSRAPQRADLVRIAEILASIIILAMKSLPTGKVRKGKNIGQCISTLNEIPSHRGKIGKPGNLGKCIINPDIEVPSHRGKVEKANKYWSMHHYPGC